MDDIIARIGISKGSASLGLRALEEMGAVERQANGRFGFYTAKRELKTLISGFVRQRLVPRLEKSNAKLRELAALLDQMAAEEASESEWRLKRVAQWHTRATQFLPLAEKLLGAKREHVAVGTARADNSEDCPAGATRSGERESTMKQESET
jgi:DNA-binding transcriptional regulator GbsR (MarR family)